MSKFLPHGYVRADGPVTDGLFAEYDFVTEESNGVLKDFSGNGRHATIQPGSTITSTGLYCNGSNGGAKVASFPLPSDSFTVHAIYNVPDSSAPSFGAPWRITYSNGRTSLIARDFDTYNNPCVENWVGSEASTSPTAGVTDTYGKWLHITAVFTPSTVKVYLNGGPVTSESRGGLVQSSPATSLDMGSLNAMYGYLAYMMFYSRSLGDKEVAWNHQYIRGRLGPRLIAFNQGHRTFAKQLGFRKTPANDVWFAEAARDMQGVPILRSNTGYGPEGAVAADTARIYYEDSDSPVVAHEVDDTNRFLNSEAAGTSTSGTNLTVTRHAVVGPGGWDWSAAKLTPTTTSTTAHYFKQSVTGITNNTATMSCFVKANGYRYFNVEASTKVPTYPYAVFDLQDGVVVTKSASLIDARIFDAGDGWYRVSITVDLLDGDRNPAIALMPRPAPSPGTWAGDGTSGAYVCGVMVSRGSALTTYIPTGASAVTRNVESLGTIVTPEVDEKDTWTLNFGVYFTEVQNGTNYRHLIAWNSPSGYNTHGIHLVLRADTNQPYLERCVNGNKQVQYLTDEYEPFKWYLCSQVCDGSTIKLYVNGELVATTSSPNAAAEKLKNLTTASTNTGYFVSWGAANLDIPVISYRAWDAAEVAAKHAAWQAELDAQVPPIAIAHP